MNTLDPEVLRKRFENSAANVSANQQAELRKETAALYRAEVERRAAVFIEKALARLQEPNCPTFTLMVPESAAQYEWDVFLRVYALLTTALAGTRYRPAYGIKGRHTTEYWKRTLEVRRILF